LIPNSFMLRTVRINSVLKSRAFISFSLPACGIGSFPVRKSVHFYVSPLLSQDRLLAETDGTYSVSSDCVRNRGIHVKN
jgi:hypothetical protein